MNSRALMRWSQLHERRARTMHPAVGAVLLGGAVAGWVGWRSTASAGAGSGAWFSAALVWCAIEMMRIPFHIYWRGDASLLAQLPIGGGALFDAAIVRCLRAAARTTFALAIAALPLIGDADRYARHVAVAAAIGVVLAALIPAVVVWTASLVALDEGAAAATAIRAATAIVGATPAGRQMVAVVDRTASTALLGAVPGFVGAIVLCVLIAAKGWLADGGSSPLVLVVLAAVGLVAIAGVRARAGRAMGKILRDVSALDRQRLATLEIHPPTAIERLVARLIGQAAVMYAKDARLMRRRFPLAYLLGALVFLVLAIVGVARPADPTPWLSTAVAAAVAYGLVLAGRLERPPIELDRLSATLPIELAARRVAKLAWIATWWTIYVVVPGVFAATRQADPDVGFGLLGAGSAIVAVSALVRTRRR